MKIPKYIKEHIEINNKLLSQADKHSQIVLEWYHRRLEQLNADDSDIPDEDFSEIKNNWLDSGEINISAIETNLKMLEEEMPK